MKKQIKLDTEKDDSNFIKLNISVYVSMSMSWIVIVKIFHLEIQKCEKVQNSHSFLKIGDSASNAI